MKKSGRRAVIYPPLAAILALVTYTLFTVIPIVISLFYSFMDWNMERLYDSTSIGIRNYLELISNPVFLKSISNAFPFAASTTVLRTVVGFVPALALVKNLYGRGLIRVVFCVPCVISIIMVGVLFKSILTSWGPLNSTLALVGLKWLPRGWLGSYGTAMGGAISVETWTWAESNMFIFLSGLRTTPQGYYEGATLDDASAFEKSKYITMPLIMPSLTVVGTLGIAGGLEMFDIIYIVTSGGPGSDTQVFSIYIYRPFNLGSLGESTAGSVILAVIAATISFTMNRYLAKREVET